MPVDYLDGVVFSADESYLVLGRQTDDESIPLSDYTGNDIYYRSIQHDPSATPKTDRLTIHDYLWRWDTDWFWCSRAFGTQNPKIRRFWPRRWLQQLLRETDRAGPPLQHRRPAGRLQGLPPSRRVVQDIEVPIDRTVEFVDWFLENVPIEPIWLCPLRLREPLPPGADPHRPWPLYPLDPGAPMSTSASGPRSRSPRPTRIRQPSDREAGGRARRSPSRSIRIVLPPEEFAQLYGGKRYGQLKAKYDPQSRLLDLYSKAVKSQ